MIARHDFRGGLIQGLSLWLFVCLAPVVRSEDADRYRPYIHFRNGDIGPVVGVHDLWGMSYGANFNRYWGAELAADFYELRPDLGTLGIIGEQSVATLVPQVRFRYPLLGDRLVPYVIAGAGPAFLQLNDHKASVWKLDVDADSVRLGVVAGGGLEYFIADNVTVGFEAKYMWLGDRDVTVSGQQYSPNFSSTLLTFGLRVYLSENEPHPLAEMQDPIPDRFYFGVRLGASILTDDHWENGVTLKPVVAAAWESLNHAGGLSLGANFGTHWGAEFAIDFNEYILNVEPYGHIAEYSVYRLLPQLRLRWPMSRGRLVPYILAGGGVTYDEFNDRKPNGGGLDVDTLAWHPAVTAGAGLEYFLVRNFSINADVRWLYTWGHSLSIDGGPAAKGDFSDVQFFLGFRVYLFNL